MSRSDDISTAGPDHDVFRFECSRRDCSTIFAGDELASIAKRGARHLNREHGDSFHTTEQFDTIERGGHQVHGNEWAVTRIPQYVTAFDVLERIGAVDGLLVPADDDETCSKCLRVIHDDGARIDLDETERVDPDTPAGWWCEWCVAEREIEEQAAANASLNDFSFGEGDR
ncbi:hypothetical protein [Halorubrum lacusprofundi]|jgi:hypothetical protein|uniref:Uncharacterized protein n=1 Tax=Halorubrum lacusprofundi TaxID=2247 RepID=A0A220SX27_9EURY|nr:hypothetical protein [Halorubrum lacusprofundi]ASK38171.1 hypothetical protein [Halorubrum lacusprofundi]MCG1008280.1 hypothetical protein [Halorubrum lacusprofundi]